MFCNVLFHIWKRVWYEKLFLVVKVKLNSGYHLFEAFNNFILWLVGINLCAKSTRKFENRYMFIVDFWNANA